MTIRELLNGIKYEANVDLDVDIADVTADSRKVAPGSVFVCVSGTRVDAHVFAADARKAGAVAVIGERDTGDGSVNVLVENCRKAYAAVCSNFYGRPQKELKLVGVTGTNGKTTTSVLIKNILEYAGRSAGLIGTISNVIGGKEVAANYTTPEPKEFFHLLRQMADSGAEYVVSEVSSHALDQSRVDGCIFDVGVFTNLTQDHLDYHITMEAYAAAKAKLFGVSRVSVINADDPAGEQMLAAAEGETLTYSAKSDNADLTAKNVELKSTGASYELVTRGDIARITTRMPGMFNVYNTLAAASAAYALGIPLATVKEALAVSSGVKGRLEVVPTDTDYTVIIDYAHTPDGIENILRAVRDFAEGRVICLFGCGGDRDKTKRPLMGETAASLADYLFITSDNPRTEDPDAIIADILEGVKDCDTPYTVITDRTKAIEAALNEAQAGDVIILAGKGHENYQILGTEKIHYDEREIVADILSKK